MVKRDFLINFVFASLIKGTSRYQSALALGLVFCCLGLVYMKDDISLVVDDRVKSSVLSLPLWIHVFQLRNSPVDNN